MKKFLAALAVIITAVLALLVMEDKPQPNKTIPLAYEISNGSETTDDIDPLNSWTDGRPAKCSLKPEEREWLQKAMDNGELRLATKEDIAAWEEKAKSKGNPSSKMLDCGRTYTILKPITIPGQLGNERFSGEIVFIVSKSIAFPHFGRGNGSPVYDLNTGGAIQLGHYYIGNDKGLGFFPTSTQKTWE